MPIIDEKSEVRPIRHVVFKNVIYDLRNGDLLKIHPVPNFTNEGSGNLLKMDHELYLIETSGKLETSNMSEETLKNFSNFLSNYHEALKRLT